MGTDKTLREHIDDLKQTIDEGHAHLRSVTPEDRRIEGTEIAQYAQAIERNELTLERAEVILSAFTQAEATLSKGVAMFKENSDWTPEQRAVALTLRGLFGELLDAVRAPDGPLGQPTDFPP